MSRNEQIEEMAQCLCEWNRGTLCILDDKDCDLQCTYGKLANKLTAKGYRKSTDVAEEIFAEIEEIIDKHYNKHIFGSDLEDTEKEAVMDFSGDVTYDIDELKKKYTEGGNERDG